MAGPPIDDHIIDKAIRELSDWIRAQAGTGLYAGSLKRMPQRRWPIKIEQKCLDLVLWLFDRAPHDDSANLGLNYVHTIRKRFAGLCLKYKIEGLPAQDESWYSTVVQQAKDDKLHR